MNGFLCVVRHFHIATPTYFVCFSRNLARVIYYANTQNNCGTDLILQILILKFWYKFLNLYIWTESLQQQQHRSCVGRQTSLFGFAMFFSVVVDFGMSVACELARKTPSGRTLVSQRDYLHKVLRTEQCFDFFILMSLYRLLSETVSPFLLCRNNRL